MEPGARHDRAISDGDVILHVASYPIGMIAVHRHNESSRVAISASAKLQEELIGRLQHEVDDRSGLDELQRGPQSLALSRLVQGVVIEGDVVDDAGPISEDRPSAGANELDRPAGPIG